MRLKRPLRHHVIPFLIPMILGSMAGGAGSLDPPATPEASAFETFLAAERPAIEKECDFKGRHRDDVHGAAFLRFKRAVGRRLDRAGDAGLKEAWKTIDQAAPGDAALHPFFPALLRSYAGLRYGADVVEMTRMLVRCRTVLDPAVPSPGNPWFRRAQVILDSVARAHDFESVILAGGLAMELSFGEGPDTLGIWGHLDVVPADSSRWSFHPWSADVAGDTLRGRGVEDDKGPVAAALFALRALRDSGVPVRPRVVLVAGFAEESSFDCIRGYLRERPAPSLNIVVDGSFPAVVAEKGTVTLIVSSRLGRTPMQFCRTGYNIREIRGGLAANQVPDHALIRLDPIDKHANIASQVMTRKVERFNAENSRARLSVTRDGDHVVVEAAGKSAHGSTPREGHNAIADLVQFVYESIEACPGPPLAIVSFLREFVGEDATGRGLGISVSDSLMGRTTVNAGVVASRGDSAFAMLNIRFPRGLTAEGILETVRRRIQDFDAQFKTGLAVERSGVACDPIHVDPRSPVVRELVAAYRDVYGGEEQPVSTPGTTYALELPQGVSFGPGRPGVPTRAHAADEYMTLDELDRLVRCYTGAWFRLTRPAGEPE